MSEGLQAFAKKYNRSIDDPKLRRLYELDLSARMDDKSRMTGARNEGREEVILGMLKNGLPETLICQCVNAPRNEVIEMIRSLRAKMFLN